MSGISTSSVQAAVMVGPWKSELRSFAYPRIDALGGVVRVEASGVCGADIHYYSESGVSPRILGHEIVGTVEDLGDVSAEAWGLERGDRVVLEEYLPCGYCRFCRSSEFRLCLGSDPSQPGPVMRYGSTSVDMSPSLWGGYSEHMYLHPRSVLHKAPLDVPATALALTLPVANGFEWTCREGGVEPGQAVVIIGPGQQGLSCVVAAKEAGATTIISIGRSHDDLRLRAAERLGATHVLRSDLEDIVQSVLDLTGGEGADLVIDAAAGSNETVLPALSMLRKRGRFILPTGNDAPVSIPMGLVQEKYLTIKGVRGHSWEAVEWAIRLIERDSERFLPLSTHTFGLAEVDTAIRTLAGKTAEQSIHVTVVPDAS